MTLEEAIEILCTCEKKPDWKHTEGMIKEACQIVSALKLPHNDPLILEEMREIGGEPYWHVGLQEDSAPPHWNILDPFYAKHIEDYGYGKRWIAYRNKPDTSLDRKEAPLWIAQK